MTPIQATAIWYEKLNSLSKKNKSLNNWNDSPRTRKSQFIKRRTKSILKGNMNYKDEISQWKLKGLIRELCFAVYVCTYVYGGGFLNSRTSLDDSTFCFIWKLSEGHIQHTFIVNKIGRELLLLSGPVWSPDMQPRYRQELFLYNEQTLTQA